MGDDVVALTFVDRWDPGRLVRRFGDVRFVPAVDPAGAATSLRAYLGGRLDALDDLSVDPGGTEFQRRVWAALRQVPSGTTVTYGEMAADLGRPGAARAVGRAVATNPVWLVIPCHRVVPAGGGVGGYAGGPDRKRWLLDHEAASVKP